MGQRLWPQTERLKAELLRRDGDETRVLKAYSVLESYIQPAPPGLWLERRAAAGQFPGEPAPASSLYHLTAAITASRQFLMAGGMLKD
jgi:mannose/cellobiose epimerase-like protein (N-acyl-D-glucosamine 2-epimerase family)